MDALRVDAAVPAAREPGDPFPSRYRPVRLLKRGNGVDTWLVVDLDSGRRVVLKSIDSQCVHAAARLRFQHETAVLRELAGTGLPGLVDAGRTGDRLFLVQPYLSGRTLERRLADAPLPLLEALRVAAEIAGALDIAHGAGVVHRDVKPANVVLGDDGAVALIDFGFARSPSWTSPSATSSSAPCATWRRRPPGCSRRRSTSAPTSTRSACCCSRPLRDGRRSSARRSARCCAST